MQLKKIIVITGSVVMAGGCFFPIITAPDRTFTFFDKLPVPIPDVPENALQYAGIAIMAIGALCALLAGINRNKFTWLGGIASAAILTCVYFGFHAKLDEMKTQADKQLEGLFGGMFKGVTDSLFKAVELGGTGWYIIGSGALLVLLSVFIKETKTSTT